MAGQFHCDNAVRIGMIKTINRNQILVSWRDDTGGITYGVDILTANFYTGYTCNVDSQLYSIATDDDPGTYEKCQFNFGKALKAGDKVKIEARYGLSGAFP